MPLLMVALLTIVGGPVYGGILYHVGALVQDEIKDDLSRFEGVPISGGDG